MYSSSASLILLFPQKRNSSSWVDLRDTSTKASLVTSLQSTVNTRRLVHASRTSCMPMSPMHGPVVELLTVNGVIPLGHTQGEGLAYNA